MEDEEPKKIHPWRKKMVDVKKERKKWQNREGFLRFRKNNPSYYKQKDNKYLRNSKPTSFTKNKSNDPS